MLGYDMSWAAFWMVEVMALPWFGHKRVAFMAASQCFTPETEVSLLTTHLFKKVCDSFTNSVSIPG
jgi:AP-3 complex subunit delta-1